MGTLGDKAGANERGGTRVPCELAATLTSHDPSEAFSEPCQIILVNLHGCAARLPRSVRIGTIVELKGLPGNHNASARVVNCFSLGRFERNWILGLALDEPGNVWGIEPVPQDWNEDNISNSWGSLRKEA